MFFFDGPAKRWFYSLSVPIKIGERGMMASQLKRIDSEGSLTLLLSDDECNSACSFLRDSDVKRPHSVPEATERSVTLQPFDALLWCVPEANRNSLAQLPLCHISLVRPVLLLCVGSLWLRYAVSNEMTKTQGANEPQDLLIQLGPLAFERVTWEVSNLWSVRNLIGVSRVCHTLSSLDAGLKGSSPELPKQKPASSPLALWETPPACKVCHQRYPPVICGAGMWKAASPH